MPRKTNLLNVREYVKWSGEFATYLIEAHTKGQAQIPPIYLDECKKISFIARAIVRKADKARAKRGNRKDLYIEADRA